MRETIVIRKNLHIIIIIISSILLILIAGLRPIGIDSDSYNYASILHVPLYGFNFTSIEPFVWLIIGLNRYLFSGNEQAFFLMFALLGVTLKLYAIKRISLFPMLSIITYISLYFVLHEMIQIRVGVAAGIFLLSLPDIARRNLTGYLFKTTLACMFHYSAIIMLVVYFFRPNKINKYFYMALPIIGISLAVTGDVILRLINIVIGFFPMILSYRMNLHIFLLGEGISADINLFNIYYSVLLLLYYFLLFNYGKMKSEYDLILIKIFGLMLFSFYALSSVPVLAFRVSEFLGVVLIILIPHSVFMFKQKAIATFSIMVVLITYFVFIMLSQNLNINVLSNL